MTLARRIVVCLDVSRSRVVKDVEFREFRDVGDPVAMAERYEQEGADEIVLLDFAPSPERRSRQWDMVRRTAEGLFIPLTLGGGVRSIADVGSALRAGADKVAINSAAVGRPELLTEAQSLFGAQCVVASIDAKRDPTAPSGWRVYVHGGRMATARDVLAWATECVDRGAGEVLLTSIDCDGTRTGYDLSLTRTIASAVRVPVVASGGAGAAAHVYAVFQDGLADAALVAGILHDGLVTINSIKTSLAAHGVPVRSAV